MMGWDTSLRGEMLLQAHKPTFAQIKSAAVGVNNKRNDFALIRG
jgi:hypothetical protein